MNLLRRLFRRPDDSLLGLISFDDSNFRRVVTEPDQVEWITPDDDAILLSRAHGEAEFLNKAQSVDEIRKHCGQELYDRHESAEPFVWLFEFGFPTVAGRNVSLDCSQMAHETVRNAVRRHAYDAVPRKNFRDRHDVPGDGHHGHS